MAERICLECSYIGTPARKKRGSGKMEFVMWMLFPLGIPYSLWRMAHKYPVCRHCGGRQLMDTASQIGNKLARHHTEIPVVAPPAPPVTAPAIPPQSVAETRPAPQSLHKPSSLEQW